MYAHLLVPTDGSPRSTHAIDQALALATALKARITFCTVIEPFHVIAYVPEQIVEAREAYERHARQEADRRLKEAEDRARAAGVPCDMIVAHGPDPYQAIIDTANERGCDLIAMASHGRRGVAAMVLGSETSKVLTHSTIPVLVYRHKAE